MIKLVKLYLYYINKLIDYFKEFGNKNLFTCLLKTWFLEYN